MSKKFKFKSNKKQKLYLLNDKNELLYNENIVGSHIELFSNKRAVIEGCKNIIEYQDNYVKLKIKKGFFILTGTNFFISVFDEEKIDIKGNILNIEFCI